MRGDSCEDQHLADSGQATTVVQWLSQGQQKENQAGQSSQEVGAAGFASGLSSSQLGGLDDQWQGPGKATSIDAGELGSISVNVLPASCPLFGRKIAGQGAAQWADVLSPMLAGEQP